MSNFLGCFPDAEGVPATHAHAPGGLLLVRGVLTREVALPNVNVQNRVQWEQNKVS
jgi:hypothetical protein